MLLVQLSGHWESAVPGQCMGRAAARRGCTGSLGLELGTQCHFGHLKCPRSWPGLAAVSQNLQQIPLLQKHRGKPGKYTQECLTLGWLCFSSGTLAHVSQVSTFLPRCTSVSLRNSASWCVSKAHRGNQRGSHGPEGCPELIWK